MSRLVRLCPSGIPTHIIQRGHNREVCFVKEKDFSVYENWLDMSAVKFGVAIHAWVFMKNHVHILATPQAQDSISRMMQEVSRRYVRYFNDVNRRTGTLWEGRFKSCVVEPRDYLLSCQRYIELNPVRAHMVGIPSDYPWSSYRPNAIGTISKLLTPHETYLNLGKCDQDRTLEYRNLFTIQIDEVLLKDIRASVNKGLALGSEQFKNEIERLTGRRVTPGRRGPKKQKSDFKETSD